MQGENPPRNFKCLSFRKTQKSNTHACPQSTLVPAPPSSAASLLTWGWVTGSAVFIAGTQQGVGQSVLKRPKFPGGLQVSVFKVRGRDSLMGQWSSSRAVSQGLPSSVVRLQLVWAQAGSLFHPVGLLVSVKQLRSVGQTLSSASPREEPRTL